MPRPNRPRSMATEAALARRISYERERRGMTPAGLAARMEAVGCPINASAIYKIERWDPPRRITVDELVALSRVFEIAMPELLMPPEVAARRELVDLMKAWSAAREALRPIAAEERGLWHKLVEYVGSDPEVAPHLEGVITDWVIETFPEEQRQMMIATYMHSLTLDQAWLHVAIEGMPTSEREPVQGDDGIWYVPVQMPEVPERYRVRVSGD